MNLYGAHVRIDFLARLRDTMRFPDAAALIAQLGPADAFGKAEGYADVDTITWTIEERVRVQTS